MMSEDRVLVIGANGKIGRIFCQIAGEGGLQVRAMVREARQRKHFEAAGTECVEGDLEGEFAHAMEGCAGVVFTAGSGGKTGGDKTLMVDLYGALQSIQWAEQLGIQHFVMVSALRCDHPMAAPPAMRHYMVAKKLADERLVGSSLAHTILRPGRLTNKPPTGAVTVDPGENSVQAISRANVAQCILASLRAGGRGGRVIGLLDGPTPIDKVFPPEG